MSSPAAAQLLISEALRFGALERVPDEVHNFRAFCEGPLRRALRANVAQPGIEQIFERIGYVLSMATNDPQLLEVARGWSEPGPSDRDGDSGVRNVEVTLSGTRPTAPDPSSTAERTSSRAERASNAAERASSAAERTSSAAERTSNAAERTSSATLGRMRAVGKSMTDLLRANEEIVAPREDPRSEPFEVPSHVALAVLPSAVLVVSLDAQLVREVREGMAQHAPVRAIAAASELVGSLVTSGERVVILIDTALPSIAVSTFAGLVPVLPDGTRVVLWGASRHQLMRLNALYPDTKGWIVREGERDPVALLLTLPDPR